MVGARKPMIMMGCKEIVIFVSLHTMHSKFFCFKCIILNLRMMETGD